MADLLARQGRGAEAERSWRAALALDRRFAPAAVGLAEHLLSQGRAEEAVQVTTPAAAVATADLRVLTTHADGLKALGRTEEALAVYTRAVYVAPDSVAAEHNHAALLGDLGRYEEALAGADRALSKGGGAPETWLVKARALQGAGRLAEAEAAYRRALALRTDYAEAHRDLAQLVWMTTADKRAAVAALDEAIRARPDAVALIRHKARLLEFAGDPEGALGVLQAALARRPDELGLLLAAVQPTLLAGRPDLALRCAEAGLALAPGEQEALWSVVDARLALGEPEQALQVAERLRAEHPNDQRAMALEATCRRLLGDPRYAELYDYAAFVRPWRVEAPEGWASREVWLADLAAALERLHPYKTHPLDQSVRHGSQASHLQASPDPAIRGFFQAIDAPIRAHLAALGRGRDPLRARNKGGYRIEGAWSVRLRGEGHHADHIHSEGWLSSAFYVALPRSTSGSSGREGWIRFGRPGVVTRPELGAEHFVEPEPGMLVLFPSYMWHGTVPFSGDDQRLTIAFDILPAKG